MHLSVDPRLLPPAKRASAPRAIRRSYRRLWRRTIHRRPRLRTVPSFAAPGPPPTARRRNSPLTLAALALHPALTLLLFFSLALHVHGRLDGWPRVLGTSGFPRALSLHAELSFLSFGSQLIGFFAAAVLFSPRLLGLPFPPRVRRGLDYLGLYALLGFVSLGLTFLAPDPFLYWWWD